MAEINNFGEVKALVSDSVFKRALEIEASDKLRGVHFDEEEDLHTARAECVGSSPSDIYVLKASVNRSAAVGDCSCPAGKNSHSGLCKHVVALLLRRVKEAQRRKAAASSPGRADEEEGGRISSHIHAVGSSENAGKGVDAGANASSSPPRSRFAGGSSSSRRALPAWMLGVAGSAGEAGSPPKSKKRAAPPNPPRPVPAVRKRARRGGDGLKIASFDDDGSEDPGEVEDAGPAGKSSGSGAVEKLKEVSEPVDGPSAGALARERRRQKEQKKKEDDSALWSDDGDDDDEDKNGKRRLPRRSAAKKAEGKPAGASKRTAKRKFVAEDSDLSEDEPGPADSESDVDLRLTDDDLMLLAREQLQRQNAEVDTNEGRRDAEGEGSSKVEDLAEKPQPQRKPSSSIFSMDMWRQPSSSEYRDDTRKAVRENPHQSDMELLKTMSQKANSQIPSQGDMENTEEVLPNYIPKQSTGSMPDAFSRLAPAEESDAIANDMFSLMFGGSIQEKTKSPGAVRVRESSNLTTSVGSRKAFETLSPAKTATALAGKGDEELTGQVGGGRLQDDVSLQPKPKKKSSLKDTVKMLLG